MNNMQTYLEKIRELNQKLQGKKNEAPTEEENKILFEEFLKMMTKKPKK